ncbi:integrase core domain-containing protein [Spirochaeta isovalerica]|uniref:integrase core domain-containing protein n=1 Tax=Spirochaeta isovalerica TaxID=150 RepID=UPI003CCCEADB
MTRKNHIRTVRHEWLDLVNFELIEHAQKLATDWFWTYNNKRPHSAIGGVPPRIKTPIARANLLMKPTKNGGAECVNIDEV